MFVNKAIIFGNLTADPELKSLPSGISVVNAGVATNRVYKDKDGQKQESAEFHNVVFFGRTAEVVAQYLKKGSSIYVEGRLQTRSWEADGIKKYRTEIVSENMQLGPRRDGGEQKDVESPNDAKQEHNINPDDIPF